MYNCNFTHHNTEYKMSTNSVFTCYLSFSCLCFILQDDSLLDAHDSSNMTEVEDIIAECRDKIYALVSVYKDQST